MAYTRTYTYTRARALVVRNQFDYMLLNAGVAKAKRKLILDSLDRREVEAIGIYITDDEGCKAAEVSLTVDWVRHDNEVRLVGDMFAEPTHGWENGTAPEVNTAVTTLVEEAERCGKTISTWILFSQDVRRDDEKHKQLCSELGYQYGSSAPGWSVKAYNDSHVVRDLPELVVDLKVALK